MSKPYKVCPKCGAHLDFGEACDCEEHMQQETSDTADLAVSTLARNECESTLMLNI